MQDALAVGRAESAGELDGDVERSRPGQRERQLVQALAAHELRCQVGLPIYEANAVDRQHVRVLQSGDSPRLNEKALAGGVAGVVLGNELHRH